MGTTRKIMVAVSVAAAGAIGIVTLGSTGAVAQSSAAYRWQHNPAAARTAAPLAAKAGAHVRTIVLNEVFGPKFTFVDVGERGDSPGDYGVFQDRVTNPGSGHRVGVIDVQCVEAYASHCRGAITLSGRGQIVFDGTTPTTVDPDQYAVTGGTGEFVGAAGTFTVSFPSDDYALLTIELARDR